jgi:hypothetical protein
MNKVDKTYWGSDLPLPLSPSDKDVEVYKNYLKEGTTLMLGCTKKLIPLSNRQLDIDPWYEEETVILGDWTKNEHFYTNIIIDGGLNLTKKLCDDVVEMASKNCEIFISRAFRHRLDTMKVAAHFPKASDFKIVPKEVIIYDDYVFYIWKF